MIPGSNNLQQMTVIQIILISTQTSISTRKARKQPFASSTTKTQVRKSSTAGCLVITMVWILAFLRLSEVVWKFLEVKDCDTLSILDKALDSQTRYSIILDDIKFVSSSFNYVNYVYNDLNMQEGIRSTIPLVWQVFSSLYFCWFYDQKKKKEKGKYYINFFLAGSNKILIESFSISTCKQLSSHFDP